MAIVSDLLRDALRAIGVLRHDLDPDFTQEVAGLPIIVDLFARLPDEITVPRLFEVAAADGLTIGGNSLLVASQTGTATVTLPAMPNDGWRVQVVNAGGGSVTLARNGRKIVGSATNYVVPNNEAHLMYRADLGDWRSTTVSAMGDGVPYPSVMDGALSSILAVDLAPHYSRPVTAELSAAAQAGYSLLRARYSPVRPGADRGRKSGLI